MPFSMLDKLRSLVPASTPKWPEFERSVGSVASEMPAEVASMKNRTIRPLNALESMMYGMVSPGMAAVTYPTGTIAYDRNAAEAAGMRPEDLMAHELTHIKQLNDLGPLRTMAQTSRQSGTQYGDKTFEKEALDRELSRLAQRRRTTDIELKAGK